MSSKEGKDFNRVYYIPARETIHSSPREKKSQKVDVPIPHPYKIIPKSWEYFDLAVEVVSGIRCGLP